MNEFFQKLKNESLHTALSRDEKQRMRMAVYDSLNVPTPAPQLAPRRVQNSYVWFSFISSPRFAMPVAVVLVMGLGTGTAFAAQGSLPGDALYAIKVNVTEPALGALAVGDEAKAQWNARVAQTRLVEAETLAASGKLDATTSTALTQNFDTHSAAVQALAQKAEAEDPGSGEEIAAQFDSSLAAHDAILSRIGAEGTSSQQQYADEIASHARSRGGVTLALGGESGSGNGEGSRGAGVQTFAAAAPEGTSSNATSSISAEAAEPATHTEPQIQPKTPSKKLKKSAASALADAQDAFDLVDGSIDASTTLKIQGELDRIGAAIDAATSTESLTGALKDATVLEAFLKASKNFNRNFFTSDRSGSSLNTKGDNGDGNNGGGNSNNSTNAAASSTVQTQFKINSSNDQNSSGGDNQHGNDNQSQNGGQDGQGGEDSFVHHLLNTSF